MEPHYPNTVIFFIFFNPFLISPSTGYYILKRVVEDPTQVHHQSTEINPRFIYNPPTRVRGSGGGGGGGSDNLVNNIATVSVDDGTSVDEIIYSDELFDEFSEHPEYITVNGDDEELLENHILIKRNTNSKDYDNCPSSSTKYSPITCKGVGNFPINVTECILYHHCAYGKHYSQKRCCYNDRRFDHDLKVCRPHNEARCPAPSKISDVDPNRTHRATVVTAGDFSSAEFGGPAGVGNQMDGLFDAPHFHVVKPPNLVNQKGHSNSHGGDQHGGDQKGSTVNVKKVTAAKTEDKGQKNPSGNQNTGGGHPGDDVGNFFDIKKFAAARTQDGGQQSSPGNQNTGLHDPDMLSDFFDQLQNIGGFRNPGGGGGGGSQSPPPQSQNADALIASHAGDQNGGQKNPPVKSQNSVPAFPHHHPGDQMAGFFDMPPFMMSMPPKPPPQPPPPVGQKIDNQSKPGSQNTPAGGQQQGGKPQIGQQHGGQQMPNYFDSPLFGGGGGQNGGDQSSSGGQHWGDMATTFDFLHFGDSGAQPGGHIDHADTHDNGADQLNDRFGRHHKHPYVDPNGGGNQMSGRSGNGGGERGQNGGNPMNSNYGGRGGGPNGGNPMNNNYGGGGGGGGGNPMNNRFDAAKLGLDNLINLLSNLQSSIPGPFWFHNTKSGNMRPATFSSHAPVIVPIIIQIPPQQPEMEPTPYQNPYGFNDDFGFPRAQNGNWNGNTNNNPTFLKGPMQTPQISPYQTYPSSNQGQPNIGNLKQVSSRNHPNSETLDLSDESSSEFHHDSAGPSGMRPQGRTMMGGASAEEADVDPNAGHPKSKNCTTKKGRNRKSRRGKKRSNTPESLQANVTLDVAVGNETIKEDDDYPSQENIDDGGIPLIEENLENSTITVSSTSLPSSTTTTVATTSVAMETSSSSMVPPPEMKSTTMPSLLPSSTNGFITEDEVSDWASDFDDSVEVDEMGYSSTTTTPSPSMTTEIIRESVVLTGITNRHGQLVKIKPVRRRDKIKSN